MSKHPQTLKPRLTMRVGFAGRKQLNSQETRLVESALKRVFQILGNQLGEISSNTASSNGDHSLIAEYYSDESPVLRLVTGLREGADSVASQVFDNLNVSISTGASDQQPKAVETEFAAVLPFRIEDYRSSRPAEFRKEFDDQLNRCQWVLCGDGIYQKPEPDTSFAKLARARAYRLQSALLLRQCDIVIAAADPDDLGKPGGTLETVREALTFELPVIFIHTGISNVDKAIYLIEPENDYHSVIAQPALQPIELQSRLEQWVNLLTVDPDHTSTAAAPSEAQAQAREHGLDLLSEFFDAPQTTAHTASQAMVRLRKWTWNKFDRRFRDQHTPKVPDDFSLSPYSSYRDRATSLSAHYSGLYRGAFLLNFLLAIVAVILAVVSLMLLGLVTSGAIGPQAVQAAPHTNTTTTEENTVAAQHTSAEAPATATTTHEHDASAAHASLPTWLLATLTILAAIKLALLFFILNNTHVANKLRWNDRAIDYRYLAERLRGLYYLPLVGSHQPPAASSPQFASRAVRQSVVDWLFEAITRSISPANVSTDASASNDNKNSRIDLDPVRALESVRDNWIGPQAAYHAANSHTMHTMQHKLEFVQKFLSWSVICIVAVDLVLLGGKTFHLLPHAMIPFAKIITPCLIAVSAILPAIVAALSGIKFQSECQRLSERSAIMRVLLVGHPPKAPAGRLAQVNKLLLNINAQTQSPETNLGAWSHDALRFTEQLASVFVHEAAEWSVLYAKEVSEPG